MSDEPQTAQPAAQSKQIEENLFSSRYIFIVGTINDVLAKDVSRQIIAMANASSDPINILISSPGGHVESGDMIHDLIRFVKTPINVIGTGWVASAATHIFLGAPRERRFTLPNTRFLIHQPSGGVGGSGSDIEIQAREILKMHDRIAHVIARETGQPFERVKKDMDRDYWMTAKEAIDYGIVSRIIENADDIAK